MRRSARFAMACLAAGLFAGCTLVPTQVREANRRTDVASSNPPAAAIHCVARKAQEGRSGMVASSVRPMAGREHYEMAIWRLESTVAVIESAPAASGSTLTVWLHPKVLDSAAADLMERVTSC